MTRYETDVLVVGGGCAGCVAAIAAARTGARTMLVERFGSFGGTSTAVLDTFYAFYTPGAEPKQVVSGIPYEVVRTLERREAAIVRPNTYGAGPGITYLPETLKRVWDEMLLEVGVRVLLHTFVVDAGGSGIVDDRHATERQGYVDSNGWRVTAVNKGGMHQISARVVVDCSGDADVVARAGGDCEMAGRSGPQQTFTTSFRMGNVDTERAFAIPHAELHRLMREANASGRFRLPREEGSAHRTPTPGVVATIMTRVPPVDIEDVEALTAAEIEGRRQAEEYFRFLKCCVPGYENAYLESTSPWIGIRETRRILADYVLSEEDVLSARQQPDAIARCGAPIEDHHLGSGTRWRYLPEGETYDIPYRSLLPRGLENVVVAGRCFGATHDAHASARSMGTCMAMGQAAGTSAALAVRAKVAPRALSINEIRAALDAAGADFGQMRISV